MTATTDTIATWDQARCDDELCGLEVPCLWCKGVGLVIDENGVEVGCPDCLGTGSAPRFESLRKKCGCRDGKVDVFAGVHTSRSRRLRAQGVDDSKPFWDECMVCQGRGWEPNVTLEGLLEAAVKDGDYAPMLYAVPNNQWHCEYGPWDEQHGPPCADTPLLALSRAVCEAYSG